MDSDQHFDYLLVLDFEAQCLKDQNLDCQEIIELPVLIIDVKNKKILENYFHQYVKPVKHPKIYDFCNELTGITQDQVDNGIILEEALIKLDEFLNSNNVINSKFVFVTCGDWDLRTCLRHEAKYKKISYKDYLNSWINLKGIFKKQYGESQGMVGMLEKCNIQLEGRHHSGIDDTRNIAKIVLFFLNRGVKFSLEDVNKNKK